VKLLFWKKKKEFFTVSEKEALLEAIRKAEMRTSGEVRLFVESKCRFMNPMDRAQEIFLQLEMERTAERNATLVYVAVDDHQAAILGDAGIHQKVGQQYWETEVRKMMLYFKQKELSAGLCSVITDIGEALHQHFPYSAEVDKNELPDEIIFGR
jgi:uncharacterized membrane protein